MQRYCVCLLAVAMCAAVSGAGVVLQPQWEQGQRLRFAGLAKTHITTEFDGHTTPTEMDSTMRSELLWEIVETPEGGGAVIEVWWDWVRIEMQSTTLVDDVVFDSRESDEARGLVARTFGPLTKMIGKRVRLEIDNEAIVSLSEAVAPKEATGGSPEFEDLAGEAFGDEAVRYMVRSMLTWARPEEIEPGDTWSVVLASGQHAESTLQEIKESDGEQVAILRTEWSFETNEDQKGSGEGDRVDFANQGETLMHMVSIDRGMMLREESSMRMATEIESNGMLIKSTQQVTTVTTFLGVESIDDEHKLDFDRHAEGQ